MADDITNAILRQMSEKLSALEDIKGALGNVATELKQFKEETGRNLSVTNQRLAIVEHKLIDLAAQLLLMGRYVKNSHSKAILELRKRVGRLEKKVG